MPRNYDPTLHPFEAPREYTRAVNAVKLERVFAKPFLGSLDGHRDGVHCTCKHPRSLSTLLSGSCDGEVRCKSCFTFFAFCSTLNNFKMFFFLKLCSVFRCTSSSRSEFGIFHGVNANKVSTHMTGLCEEFVSILTESPSSR